MQQSTVEMTSSAGMEVTRRRAIQAIGTAALTTHAGCLDDSPAGSDGATREYSLSIRPVEASPVEYALYEPDDSALFGDPARTALENVLPDGRHTTYGYEPVPNDGYVEYEGSYYQLENTVTGRQQLERHVVRADSVTEEAVPEGAVPVESLDRPTARVIKILHSDAVSDGESGAAALLRDDGYVLRRPSERESRLADGEVDGHVVTMTDSGAWAYRLDVTTEQLTETAHTVQAVKVADSRSEFREVVFESRIDAELAPDELPPEPRALLERTIADRTYSEAAPITDPFERLLGVLGLGSADETEGWKQLWYTDELYRYSLYVDTGGQP